MTTSVERNRLDRLWRKVERLEGEVADMQDKAERAGWEAFLTGASAQQAVHGVGEETGASYSLRQRLARALHDPKLQPPDGAECEQCLAKADRALVVFGDFLLSQEAHECLCEEIRGEWNRCCTDIWDGQRALAKAVRGEP